MNHVMINDQWVEDAWIQVPLPEGEQLVRRQAGKVVLFRLTGETHVTEQQIADTVIPDGKVLVPLSVWIARQAELQARLDNGTLGVWLFTHEELASLVGSVADINQLPVIAVVVEYFVDGRANSIGHLLRSRYHYRGDLRICGDVKRDHLYYLSRCGFNVFQLPVHISFEEAQQALSDFTEPYQGTFQQELPVWRRRLRQVNQSGK